VIIPLAEGSRAELNRVRDALVAEGVRLSASQEVAHLLGVRHQFLPPLAPATIIRSAHNAGISRGSKAVGRMPKLCALRCAKPVFVYAQHILYLVRS